MQEKESEVRRRRLWEENRRRQRNTGMITPAIHQDMVVYIGNYIQMVWNKVQEMEQKIWIRKKIAEKLYYQIDPVHFFCFLCFFYVSQNSVELQGISSHEIIEKIQENHDIFLTD